MKYLSVAGHILTLLAVAFFLILAVETPEAFSQISLTLQSTMALLIGCLICVVATGVGGTVWFLVLRAIDQKVSWSGAISVVFVSQAAKYVPGNVAHHIGRVVLANRSGIAVNVALFAMLVEFAWLIGVAAILAVIYLHALGNESLAGNYLSDGWWVLSLVVLTAASAPAVGHRLMERGIRWWARRKSIEAKSVPFPSTKSLSISGVLYFFNFLIFGLLIYFLAEQIFGSRDADILALTGIFALSWVIGFISPGAPAGLGIRELVLVAGLTPFYGKEVAIGLAGMLRVTTVFGDLLTFVIGLVISRKIKRHSAVAKN